MDATSKPFYVFDDGGRAASGYKGMTDDCAVRAIAIVLGRPYQEVYDGINACAKTFRGKASKSNSRTGVHREVAHRYLESAGWEWVAVMKIGSGCTMRLRAGELPNEARMVVSLSKHLAAVVDGQVRDNHDCTRDGTRCVYGYWRPRAAAKAA